MRVGIENQSAGGYEKLVVWQRAMDLVVEVYELVKAFPSDETYALTGQIRRCSVSLPSNIAEGASRASHKEFTQFLYIALGSAAELETQLMIAERVGYADTRALIDEKLKPIKKMINALIRAKRER